MCNCALLFGVGGDKTDSVISVPYNFETGHQVGQLYMEMSCGCHSGKFPFESYSDVMSKYVYAILMALASHHIRLHTCSSNVNQGVR